MKALDQALADMDGVAAVLATCRADSPPRLGTEALLAWAERRNEQHERVRELEARVLAGLAAAAQAAGVPATLAGLEPVAPTHVRSIRERQQSLRAALTALKASDEVRARMFHRARAVVRGYLAAIAPPSRAYGPGGATAPTFVPASTRSRA